jgi:putative nucleotidyltransferase with HDIG domain
MIERLRQTYRHLRVLPDDALLARVPSAAREVVAAMAPSDRRHALVTYAALERAGADEELRLAGLLHDMGKPSDARLWHRVAAVLAPGVARRLGRTARDYVEHARRGAEKARAMRLSERVVRIIATHHETPLDADAQLLHAAERADA